MEFITPQLQHSRKGITNRDDARFIAPEEPPPPHEKSGPDCAKDLRDERFLVTLVDCWNHHLFQPLLYQVSTAGLAMTGIVILMGMRNRAAVFLHWVWAYCTWQRGARVIPPS